MLPERVGEDLAELDARHGRPAFLVRGREAADGRGQVGDHGFDVEARPCFVDQLERPFRLVDAGHRASIANAVTDVATVGGAHSHAIHLDDAEHPYRFQRHSSEGQPP